MRRVFTFFAIACQIVFAQTPPTGSGTPATTTAAQQTFRFIGNDANGFADISRMYFLVNTTSTIPANVCHGFYDRALNAFYLYDDSLSVLQGPLTGGGLSSSQCTVYFSGTSLVSASGNNITVDIRLGLNGTFASQQQKVFLWVADNGGLGTNWLETSTWGTNFEPSLPSWSPATSSVPVQTFSLTGRDLNGFNDIQRMYFVVNPTPATPANGCHGYYDRPSNAFFLYNDDFSVLTGPLAPGFGGTLQNSQCRILGRDPRRRRQGQTWLSV